MRFRYIILTILCLAGFQNVEAQDFHNTYYQFAPIVVSPAFTGAFRGNLRVNAIGRNQANPVAGGNNVMGDDGRNAFNDLSASLDGNLPFGLKDTDWISAGMSLSQSQVGASAFKRNFAGLSLAYHLSLNKQQSSVFTLGVKYGSYSTSINNNAFSSPVSLANGGVDTELSTVQVGEDNQLSVNDWMVGVMLTTPVGDNADLRIGIASDHLINPRLMRDTSSIMVGQRSDQRLNRRLNAYVQYYVSLSDRVVFNPTALYQTTANASQILLQGLFSYLVNPDKDFTLNGGLGVRINDSMDVPIFLGADWKDWQFGLSYDTNLTGLTQANSTFGALELAVSKRINWNKKAVVNPKFVCPRL